MLLALTAHFGGGVLKALSRAAWKSTETLVHKGYCPDLTVDTARAPCLP
ncbi:Uncharacterised protein [Amycolatopsis camponoti]|uniref:Uncharacterized protein n=1 Tax=Amycolatopsis camponoti TaxID=2606593 RepID=A0A6I8LSC0_9PSEU|nr:Uncharacterised protein [Amycolatopsis camponoti]